MNITLQAYQTVIKEIHQSLRDAVAGLSPEALAWRPAPETSSIAVLIVHTLGSELEVLRIVRGLPSDRVRDEEFVDETTTAEQLIARIDRADTLLDEHVPQFTEADLSSMRDRPHRPPQLGIFWLLRNLAHEREHLGHIDLTRQIYLHLHGAAAS